ncbi:hypothetical protein ACSBR1_009009 [Camellia fascicularis]
MALQKANGLWCDDKALKVKMAVFSKWRKSYADVVRGRGPQPNSVRTIKVQKGANGWLLESAVVRLKPHLSVTEFQDELQRRGYGDIKVRVGDGRQLVLSFQSVSDMSEKLSLMKDWLTNWCDSIEEWDESMAFDQVRQVWLSCYGVPLVLWNNNTFCIIGRERCLNWMQAL